MPRLPIIIETLELALAAVGVALLWRIALRPKARGALSINRLPPWNATIADFLMFGLCVVAGSFLAALLASVLVKFLPFRGDEVTVFNGSAAQLGMLLGVIGFNAQARPPPVAAPGATPTTGVFMSGLVTFLVALPLLLASAKAWELFLQLCGLPTDKQDLIGMFAHANSPWMLAIMIALAVVIAPLTEELVFRAGLYRFFRMRLPRWLALLVPALFFACLHVNWRTLQGLSSVAPLTVLAVMFSLGYERTGRIGTAVVAHSLFNLNTVMLIFCGVGV